MTKKYEHLIKENEVSSLESVPFHGSEPCINRLATPDFPLHLAIHEIRNAGNSSRRYVEPHSHRFPEVNILIGNKGALKYKIQLGDEVYEVESPASIFIPAGLEHAANVIEGSGYYVCLILADTRRAFE